MWVGLVIAVATVVGLYALVVVALLVGGRRQDARAVAGFVPDCVVLFARLLRDRRLARRHKLLVAAVIPYLALPFDLIPDFIPVAGQLDDAILVAFVLRRVVRREPRLVEEHWPGPPTSLAALFRLAGL
jgi:uncharacterized membrane protein YkvA (DUF1232 family)